MVHLLLWALWAPLLWGKAPAIVAKRPIFLAGLAPMPKSMRNSTLWLKKAMLKSCPSPILLPWVARRPKFSLAVKSLFLLIMVIMLFLWNGVNMALSWTLSLMSWKIIRWIAKLKPRLVPWIRTTLLLHTATMAPAFLVWSRARLLLMCRCVLAWPWPSVAWFPPMRAKLFRRFLCWAIFLFWDSSSAVLLNPESVAKL